MFEPIHGPVRIADGVRGRRAAPSCSTAELAAMADRLRELAPAQVESENVERIRLLEDLKAVCAAVQARETAAMHESRHEDEAARGVPAARRCRGLASRSRSRDEAPPRVGRAIWAWRARWWTRCRTPWPP